IALQVMQDQSKTPSRPSAMSLNQNRQLVALIAVAFQPTLTRDGSHPAGVLDGDVASLCALHLVDVVGLGAELVAICDLALVVEVVQPLDGGASPRPLAQEVEPAACRR